MCVGGVCVYYCSTYYKAVREGGVGTGRGGSGGHVLRETSSRGLCELVCPSRTAERGGEGYYSPERHLVTLHHNVHCSVEPVEF